MKLLDVTDKKVSQQIRVPVSKRNSRTMGSGKEFADAKIASKKVVVISKSYCPFCKKAKQVLGKYKISDENIEYIEIENRPDMDEIQVGTNRNFF